MKLTLGLFLLGAVALLAEPRVIELWPEGVPGAKPGGGEEYIEDERVYNVQRPTLTFFPAEKPNGTAVIICPGGGYTRLAISKEGTGVAGMLNQLGVTTFVLKYRLKEYGQPAPLQDVLRAVRIVRSRAAEFGVRADRIGVFGSSAGGHVAACAVTMSDDPAGKTGHELDAVSARPDFAGLQYPVITMRRPFAHAGSRRNLVGENAAPELEAAWSAETRVTKATPPVFLIHTQEDASVPVENSLMFYSALRVAGVPAEMHLFEKGPHGFGLRKDLGPASDWPRLFENWLRAYGWLPPAGGKTAKN
jgi:acetyl esterase/lipase